MRVAAVVVVVLLLRLFRNRLQFLIKKTTMKATMRIRRLQVFYAFVFETMSSSTEQLETVDCCSTFSMSYD